MATRRSALLAGAGALLSGCDTLTDLGERILGNAKVPLPGERVPVATVNAARPVGVDADAARRPLTLPEPQLNLEWPQPGGNLQHAPGHPILPRPLGEVWRTSIGSGNAFRHRMTANPIVAADTVYAMDAFGWISALDVARGGRRWQTDTRPRADRDGALGGAIAFFEGTLYAVTGLAEAMAIDPADGSIKWRAALPAPARGGLTVTGGRMLVPTTENTLVALSIEDGRSIWTFRGQPVQALPLGLASVAVDGDTIIAGLASGELTALRLTDGRPIWNESLAGNRAVGASIADIGAITAMPVVDRGRVFAVGLGGLATAVDLRSGRRVWEREIGGSQTPWSSGDWLFMLTRESQLMALGRDDGRVRWISQLPRFTDEPRSRGPISWGPPVLAGGRLLVAGSHAQLFEVDAADGEVSARLRLPAGSQLQPAVANGSAYLQTDNGMVVALRGVA